MIKSMTGFGRSSSAENNRNIIVEIRTVNHRYNDIYVRLPKSLSFLEDKVKSSAAASVTRGKTDIYISYEDNSENARTIAVDEGLAGAYADALRKIRENLKLKDDISVGLISSLPDVLKVERQEEDLETIWDHIFPVLTDALKLLTEMRTEEGSKLKDSLLDRSAGIEKYLEKIETRAPEVITDYRARLESRITELLQQQPVDENRLAAETAIFADRCSIDEEIVRLKSHLGQMKASFDSVEPVGRKLDFLIQEMNREVNTIGSKANDLVITKNVVDMKSELEKIREQVQNIE
ncbi:MAG: YicC family protein [Eubacteriales bacterium]|nr:YicC family protein [Eubacteriales bacterium]